MMPALLIPFHSIARRENPEASGSSQLIAQIVFLITPR